MPTMTRTPHEDRVLAFYQSLGPERGSRVKANTDLTAAIKTDLQNMNLADLAAHMVAAIERRAWEEIAEYPGTTKGAVKQLNFTQWVSSQLFTTPYELMRILTGHVADADTAANAAIAVITATDEEDHEQLLALTRDSAGAGTNQRGWYSMLKAKAEECNGRWTAATVVLNERRTGKVGAPIGNQNAKKNNAPGHGALSDPLPGIQEGKRQPTSERERRMRHYRKLLKDEAARSKAGLSLENVQAAYDMGMRDDKVPLAELDRIAGYAHSRDDRLRLSISNTPEQVAERLMAFYGSDVARNIGRLLLES